MSELHDALLDFEGLGWIPGIAKILTGIQEVADAATRGHLTLDATQTTLPLIANPDGPDLPYLLSLLAAHLTNQDTNPQLAALDNDTRKTVQRMGEDHVRETADYTPRDHPNEAAGLIYEAAGRRSNAVSLTDNERKKLSEKVREVNRQSTNRPR
ncbi:hypothetical protein [Streptomyces sp. NPDC056227]|uniref:hypothetical protein n=1 Tax=Streptomyces sp. NPDC056227 TaxID=3345753 RepID=UPI0035D65F2A